ncbi:hypothetical protein HME9302_01440 [Alteripontixanthobacter maritimus]|uniref:Uncharacterized protein n=1 Tax=Alteripontixanthobacter maritimus TaxID=2161824 RepID=A0A369QBE8_9SPHN|nr:hypothetical protein [Alteripontixanthobacter maritimus]RDC60239.1 hypothetical protein HME9302_01440 [Alteripontixanthobacter maritimus]
MRTRAKWREFGVLIPALLLAGCGIFAERDDHQSEATKPGSARESLATNLEQAREVEDCLVVVWDAQADRDEDFDRSNDTANGGAISCATGTSPSQFEAALAAIRAAAQSGDKARILREIGIPLLFIDAEGNRRELTDPQRIEEAFDEVFDEETLGVLRRLELSDMAVAKEQGAFFELGSIWLSVPEPGARPKLVTVNRQALGEAAQAAKRKVDDNAGQSVPIRPDS